MKTILVFLNTYNIFFFVMIVLIYFWFINKQKSETIRIFLSIFLAAIVSLLLKYLFFYPRPFEVNNTKALAGLSASPSFPSLHTAVAFAAATNVTFHKRTMGIVLLLVALIIALGRIFGNVHYPIDIFVGLIIGVSLAVFIETLYLPRKKRLNNNN